MFEEVPREHRGISRLLARPVVLGPFVVGSGMLIAALGGSVAVATVITASAIGSVDLPARPGHAVTPAPAMSTHSHLAPGKRPPGHHPGSAATRRPSPSATAVAGRLGAGSAPVSGGQPTASHDLPAGPPVAPSRPAAVASSPVLSAPSSPVASPSLSEPLGNALVYFTGYDRSSGRITYQFATRQQAAAGGAATYRVTDPTTFTATLAKSVTITSSGTLCAPAGGTCTPDQLFRAAESGFFAEVAIDHAGVLRSVVDLGKGSPVAQPVPSASPSLDSGSQAPPAGQRQAPPSSSPTPEASPSATS